jgi:hypothetical protein
MIVRPVWIVQPPITCLRPVSYLLARPDARAWRVRCSAIDDISPSSTDRPPCFVPSGRTGRRTFPSSWLGGGHRFDPGHSYQERPLQPVDPPSSFPIRLYRWHRRGLGRLSPRPRRYPPEGTTPTPDETGMLEYMTVTSAAEAADAASEGWGALTVTLARRAAEPL